MIDDQTLILYYYKDGLGDAQRQHIEQALAGDAELAQRYARLSQALDRLTQTHMSLQQPSSEAMARWRGAMDGVAGAAQRAPGSHASSAVWKPWLAAAAILVMGVGIGLHLAGDAGPSAGSPTVAGNATVLPPQNASPAPGPTSPGVVARGLPPAPFTRGLSMHLQEVQLQLASLGTVDEQQRINLLEAIMVQNRLFAKAAQRSGNPELARVLRAFEQVLGGMISADAKASVIDSERDRLLFEMAATLTKLSQPTSEVPYEL